MAHRSIDGLQSTSPFKTWIILDWCSRRTPAMAHRSIKGPRRGLVLLAYDRFQAFFVRSNFQTTFDTLKFGYAILMPKRQIPHSQNFAFKQFVFCFIHSEKPYVGITKTKEIPIFHIDYKVTQQLSIIPLDVTTQVLECNFTDSHPKIKTHF